MIKNRVDLIPYLSILKILNQEGISPILYGSVGVSLYLGKFKKFTDMDLLIEDLWLEEKWPDLITIMNNN